MFDWIVVGFGLGFFSRSFPLPFRECGSPRYICYSFCLADLALPSSNNYLCILSMDLRLFSVFMWGGRKLSLNYRTYE